MGTEITRDEATRLGYLGSFLKNDPDFSVASVERLPDGSTVSHWRYNSGSLANKARESFRRMSLAS